MDKDVHAKIETFSTGMSKIQALRMNIHEAVQSKSSRGFYSF